MTLTKQGLPVVDGASREHSSLSASGAHRWMECSAAPRLSKLVPSPPPSPAAEWGRKCHDLSEALLLGLPTEKWADEDPEMWDLARGWVRHTEALEAEIGKPSQKWVELRVDLGPLNPPVDMFGTADFVLWNPETKVLVVSDLKTGSGVYVRALDNPQLLYYVLGVVLALKVAPREIRVGVYQPRCGDDESRYAVYGWEDLIAFKDKLMAAARAAADPDAQPTAGDWCRWCPAHAVCPAHQKLMTSEAQVEFSPEGEVALPSVDLLTEEEVLRILDAADTIEAYLKEVRDRSRARLEAGEEVPGWKLVPKRGTRRWADEERAEKLLRRHLKVAGAFKRTLISPAQAEKALKAVGRPLPEGLVTSVSSGYNMVRASDARQGVVRLPAADEFSTGE